MLRQVDDDALPVTGRQQALSRDQDLGAGTGQPRIDTLVDADQLLVAEAVLTGELDQRVLVPGAHALDLADQGGTVLAQRELDR